MNRGRRPAGPRAPALCLTLALCLCLVWPLPGRAATAPAPAATAALELPATPAGRVLGRWIEVLNDADDDDALESFVADAFSPGFLSQIPAEALVAFHRDVRTTTGHATVRRLTGSSDDRLVALAEGETGSWIEITLAVDAKAPHRIVGLRVVPTEAPADAAAATSETPEDTPAVELPDTAAGRVAAAYLAAFNAGDADGMRRMEETYRSPEALAERPMDERLAQFAEIRSLMGELELHRVLSSSEDAIALVAHSARMSSWLRIELALSADDPPKLTTVTMAPMSSPEAAEVRLGEEDWEDLAELLEQAREGFRIPALAAAWVEDGAIVAQAVVGERSAGGDDPVAAGDLFHLGSITKSMVATLAGRLAERGVVSWDDTLGEVLTGIAMRPEYRQVTLESLLRHRGRIPQYLTVDDEEMAELVALPGATATEKRASFAARVLSEEPLAPGMHYSNAGYGIVAHLLERRAGKGWEELMVAEVFRPLGLASCLVGWPAADGRPDQPRGHYPEGDGLRPQALDEYPLGPWIAPAGHVSCSIADLARYAQAHLDGLAGKDGALEAATVRRLHTPPASEPGGPEYASGWVIRRDEDGTLMHGHSGSAGTFYATVALFPEDGTALVWAMNTGASGNAVGRELRRAMRERYEAVTPAAAAGER